MGNESYKVDKIAIVENNQRLALESFEKISKKSEMNPATFLRDNYSNLKVRDRKSEPNFGYLLTLTISKICFFAGIKEKVDDAVMKDLVRMILTAYSDLTLEEIYKAFELERYGLYAEKTEHFQLFNAEYVSKVLKKYKSWRLEIKQQHNISLNSEEKSNVISAAEQYEILKKATERLVIEFRDTGEVSIPCVHVFDFLYENKLFCMDIDFPSYLPLARKSVESEVKSKKSVSRQERIKIEEVLSGLESDKDGKILATAKKLVLADFFRHILNSGDEIFK